MADVQFDDFRDSRYRLHVVVVQAMARIHHQPKFRSVTRARLQAGQFARLLSALRFGVGTGVQFDDGSAHAHGCVDLRFIRVDEQRHAHAVALQRGNTVAKQSFLPGHVQPAFSGHFGALFWHEANIRRLDAASDGRHLGRGGHLQVHARLQGLRHALHVVVLNVATVLAQMQRDAVRARLLRLQCGMERVRVGGAARLAQGGDVVNVDAEQDAGAPEQDRHGKTLKRKANRQFTPAGCRRPRHGRGGRYRPHCPMKALCQCCCLPSAWPRRAPRAG